MKLPYDPAGGAAFWDAVQRLPGYPLGEEIPLRTMLFESGALYRLSATLAGAGAHTARPLLVVMDPTPMRRLDDDLKPLVLATLRSAGWPVETCVLEPDHTGQVHTDMPHIAAVKSRLAPGMAALALGSGVVTDVTKHACHLFEQETGYHVPFTVYQTANSVPAYASNMAPVFIEGVKRTLPSRYPDAIVSDLETLAGAPPEMTAAGAGDLLAIYVSFPDWYLAYRFGLDSTYVELPAALMGPLDEILAAEAAGIRAGAPESMATLAKLIILGGLAVSLLHSTAPLSGFEHVMSHILDLQAERQGRPLALHGLQVGLTTLAGAAAYARFLERFDPAAVAVDACYPPAAAMRAYIENLFAFLDPSGQAAAECWSDYRIKLDAWTAQRAALEACLADWPAVRATAAGLARPAARIAAILAALGAPVTLGGLTPPLPQAQARFAFMAAPLMRRRLTLGDLLIFFGWDRAALWEESGIS